MRPRSRHRFSPPAGYWWNPATPGSGFVIEVQGTNLFMGGFLYAASGEAFWVASTGAMTSSSQYSGSLVTYSGGQTLTVSYQAPALNASSPGNIAMTFTDDSHGMLTWPGGTISIERFDFGTGGSETAQPSGSPQTGWWWNANEAGRGFAVEVQGGTLYFAGYMYDAAGNPVWYIASGAMGATESFGGDFAQYANGQTLTGSYRAPIVVNANAGAITLQFTGTASATLTLPNGNSIQLTKFTF
jgi:hypothetical protein